MSTEHRLHYETPSTGFTSSLPLGNGRLAASSLSSPAHEAFILNEVTFWSGAPHVAGSGLVSPPGNAKDELRETQRCYLEGDFAEGVRRSKKYLESEKGNFGTNLGVGKLDIAVLGGGDDAALNVFQRELRFDEALAETKYKRGEYETYRKSFVSHPHQVLVVSFECDDPEGIKLAISVSGENEAFTSKASGETLEFNAQALEDVHSDGKCGVKGHGVISVKADGGEVKSEDGKLQVTGKKSVTILVAFNTDYQQSGTDWSERASRQIQEASKLSTSELLAAHIADFQPLYRRTSITLGPSPASAAILSTDERRKRFDAAGYDDPGMFALYFHYARYLTIAGTRETSPLPLHLQGLWNDGEACRMGWSCDYHLDINTQMNYFPTLVGALPELMQPLAAYMSSLADAGKDAARACYGCDGWVAHVFSNVWGFADPGWEVSYGLNVTGGLWMASHIAEAYEYTLDEAFLAETAYPLLRGAAEFFLDYMVEDPKTGWLLTGPSVSPENSFFVEGKNGEKEEHCAYLSPTIDIVLVGDLFAFCAYAAEHLNTDATLGQRCREALKKLPPLKVSKLGQLQEWLQDFEEAQPFHRHMSHTIALFRSAMITARHTPKLADAVGVTLERRQGRDDLEDIEFTAALFALNHARLGDAKSAFAQIGHLVGALSFDNLLSFSKPGVAGAETDIFVVDGNFGGGAAVAEMLARALLPVLGGPVEVDLLPALPTEWAEGSAKGLKLRGGLELDMEWAGGKLLGATLTASSPGSMTVYCGEDSLTTAYKANEVIKLDGSLKVVQ